MPSDAKKKQAQKKKEAAKARQAGKKPVKLENGDKEPSPGASNGVDRSNGSLELSAEGKKKFIYIWVSRRLFQHYDYIH